MTLSTSYESNCFGRQPALPLITANVLEVNAYKPTQSIGQLRNEANQLTAIMVSSRSTTLENLRRKKLDRHKSRNQNRI